MTTPPDEERYAPDAFFEPDSPFPGTIITEPVPGSEGGLIEAVKRAVTQALREAITNTGMSLVGTDSKVTVNLEYPIEEESYPGIWVQFSVTNLTRAGLSHELWLKDDDDNWIPMQEWMFQGRVTLNIVALSNKERDRISDAVITMFAFSRTPDLVLTDPARDTKQYRSFLTQIEQNPYVSMVINTDVLGSGGQSAQMGMLPWQQDILVYEDTYTFDLLGQFNILFKNDGWYTLRRVDVNAEMGAQNVEYNPAQWRGTPLTTGIGNSFMSNNVHQPPPRPADSGWQANTRRRY